MDLIMQQLRQSSYQAFLAISWVLLVASLITIAICITALLISIVMVITTLQWLTKLMLTAWKAHSPKVWSTISCAMKRAASMRGRFRS